MIIEVKKWPESQDVMHSDEWFFIMAGDSENDPLGNSAYARIVDNKNKYLDEGYSDKGYQESQRQLKIATDALNLLSRYPVASLNYAYVAISALEEMYPMRKTLREAHEKITLIKEKDQNEDK
jgi:hypothetical protein